jgi:beta-phosphoglucomutase-like phosphatase (HAD superfamily)
VDEIYAEKCRLFNLCPEAPKMPGAEQVLQRVRDAGLRIAVVTGSGQGTLLQRLETNYRGFFRPELIVSSRDCERGKPNPDPYLLGLQRVGVSADAALVVENAPLGVMAAHAAGIFTIAVNTGPLPDSALMDAGADVLFPSMSALAANIDSLLG